MNKKKTINVFTENIYPDWKVDEVEIINNIRHMFDYFLDKVLEKSALAGFNFDTITFDILFCDGGKTHQINKEYRDKDYAADIITFAIFADDEAKLILDNDINLGEILLALDKVQEEANIQNVDEKYELYFLIAHGILHLLGFDHQTEEDYNFMVRLQKEALEYTIGKK